MTKMIKQRFNQKGFTLVELMVVIAILGILAAIAIPKFTNATAAANTAKIQADLRTIDSALVMFQAETGGPYIKNDLTGLTNYLADTPKPPKGKCIIKGVDTDIDATVYAVDTTTDKAAPRATFMTKKSSDFGKAT